MIKKILSLGIITLSIVSGFVFTRLDSYAETAPTQPIAPVAQKTLSKQAESPESKSDSVAQKSIPQRNLDQLKNIGRDTPKNRFFKFIIAMLGVIISALAIYGGLKLYKKLLNKNNMYVTNPNDDRSLETPKDFKSAINLFLNKTDI